MTDSDRIKLQRLFDRLGEAALDDPEMACEILTDAGLDPDRVAAKGTTLARELYGAARLRAASARRAEVQQRVATRRDRLVARARAAGGDFKTELAWLLSGGDAAQLQAHFRKIEDLGEDDALDMLTDAEILRLLDETDTGDDPGQDG